MMDHANTTDKKIHDKVCKIVYRDYRCYSFIARYFEVQRYDFLHWLVAHLSKEPPHKEFEFLTPRGGRVAKLYFLHSGVFEYLLYHENRLYRTIYKGVIFGLEDYIYRLPTPTRHLLADKRVFFCDQVIGGWPKRKFAIRAKKKA